MPERGQLLLLAATAGLIGCGKPAVRDTGKAPMTEDPEPSDTGTQDTAPPADADGDGWPSALDCDDSEASIYPGAPEYCDGVDQDCDGFVDEDAVDASTWFADTDGDGYGAPDDTTWACDQPDGYLADDQDCDDTDASIHPQAYDLCNDGVDQDCDGADKSCPYSGVASAESAAYATFVGANAGDKAGGIVSRLHGGRVPRG